MVSSNGRTPMRTFVLLSGYCWASLLAIPGIILLFVNGFWIVMVLGYICARYRDVELFVRLYDRFAVGFSYSDLPNFVAGPLLSAAGANSDTMTARLDDFSAFEADLRFMPFRSAFFVGSSFGRQALKGAVTESTVVGPQTATVDATTWYVTPRAGWLWTFERGFLLGVDLGVQLKLAGSDTVTVPAGSPPEVRSKAQNLADVGTSYPLPSFHFRVGWIF